MNQHSKKYRQFGLWESPVASALLAEDRRLDAPQWDSDGATLVWLEGRSARGVLVAQANDADAPRDLTSELSVRAEVGYGGGDFTVSHGHAIFCVHRDGRLFRQPLVAGSARPITPPFGQAASPVVSPDGRFVAYVHHDGAEDRIAVVDVEGRCWPRILAEGHDFFMQPRFSPDGRYLAYVAWDHPNMPWDGTSLYVAAVEVEAAGLPRLGQPRLLAGGPETAIFQPEFTRDARTLVYVSDESGWGRIVAHELATDLRRWLTPDGVEHALPAWVQGLRTYAIGHDGSQIFAIRQQAGFDRVVSIDLADGATHDVASLSAYTEVAALAASPNAARMACVASNATTPRRVVECELGSETARIAARSSGETIRTTTLAQCEAISWTSDDGEPAHGLYYAPASDSYCAAGKPPLVVWIHGGPTSQVRAGWRADAQFFATRGYGVLFVNYRGSTGYGRAYMLKLRCNWGICDVQDAISGMRYLAETGRIDERRAIIMGGSAGGFTVLQAMTVQPEVFAAGICSYGVANQFSLASDTHKFESRYLDTMLGPLPEASALYRERSPVLHAAAIRRPLAIFQGDIDRVVPREQSDSIVEALKRNGVPHEYHLYTGEGHGWRKRETIEHFYNAVDAFLRRQVIFA